VGAALYGVDVLTARIASAAVIATVRPQSSSSETILQALPECSDSIIVMKNDLNKQIIVIGTAHISESSVDLVRRTIQKITPDVVMIELDAKRIGRVDDGRTLQELGFDIPEQQKVALLPNIVDNKYDAETRVIKRDNLLVRTSKAVGTMVMASIKQAAGALLGKALGQFYDSVEKLGFTAGGEFKAAVEEAKRCNATVLLGDQDVDVTLQRLAAALSQVDSKQLNILLDKLSQVEKELGLSLPNEFDIANKEEISTFVEQMKQKRSVNKLLSVIKMEVPAIYNALIGDRDLYMARSMISSPGTNMVGIVGIAHIAGIERNLEEVGGFRTIQRNCPVGSEI